MSARPAKLGAGFGSGRHRRSLELALELALELETLLNAGTRAVDSQKRRRMLVVLGEGGHTTELLRLIELLGDRYEYHCLISKEDNLTAERVPPGSPVYRVSRPRGKDTGKLVAGLRTIWVGLSSLWVLARVRPTSILSTGPAIAVPVSVLGKVFGVQILFVETGSRIRTVSMTGRIMYRWADVFFVQWPQLQEQLPKAIYAGRLV